MKFINLLLLLCILIYGCEQIEDPFPENQGQSVSLGGNTEIIVEPALGLSDTNSLKEFITNNSWDTIVGPDNSNSRFMLLEEFTGHTCINCVPATKEVVRLDSIYGDQLIPLAIHTGNFAEPFPPSFGKYTTDFRIKGGSDEEYRDAFGVESYPRGIVSRVSDKVSSKDSWQSELSQIKDDPALAILEVKNYYSALSNVVRIQIDIEWLQDLSGAYSLQVYLVEDNIIDWQKNGNIDIENYNHRHVLRKVVNGTWGKSLNQAISGETQSIQYITSVDENWKSEDLESVVFIFNSDVNSYEIIQANAAYFE